ncbi:hypothetical protein PPERSA_12690 [Pseudocohnilembus persalinus]|uniref:Uncharacterized protein n=1 Tax=Pseudocohnilembus persalinus TaxID=266149 RepID=A0A0V0QU98_PSEPJ|nr:hypothetical protein PPERSA_12690 [Pseudocohnilembus persalinus]|eukprot:KRX05512.1 hypothetical protein PPERSA_12690 [Pseudocohnilembus persalinus]
MAKRKLNFYESEREKVIKNFELKDYSHLIQQEKQTSQEIISHEYLDELNAKINIYVDNLINIQDQPFAKMSDPKSLAIFKMEQQSLLMKNMQLDEISGLLKQIKQYLNEYKDLKGQIYQYFSITEHQQQKREYKKLNKKNEYYDNLYIKLSLYQKYINQINRKIFLKASRFKRFVERAYKKTEAKKQDKIKILEN